MFLIKDFMQSGEIITFDAFCNVFGKNAETQFAYNIIFNALKKVEIEIKLNLELQNFNNNAEKILFKSIEAAGISRKAFYNIINEKSVVSIKSEYRDLFSIEEHDPFVWQISLSCTSEIKLIQLQWKILHNIYPTGTLLHKMKIKQTENCDFCGQRDTLIHFFFHCAESRKIWKKAESYVYNKTGVRINFDEKRVIIGILNDDSIHPCTKQSLNIINKVILIGKHTISKFKFDRNGCPIILFEKEIWIRNLD